MKKKRNKTSDNKTPVDEPRKKSPAAERDYSDENLSTSCTATSVSERVSAKDRGKLRISPALRAPNPAAPSNQRRQRKTTSDNQPGNKLKDQVISTKKQAKRTPDKKRTRDIEDQVLAPDAVNDLTSKKVSTRKKNKKRTENISEEQKLFTQQCSEEEVGKPKKQIGDPSTKKPAKKSHKRTADQVPSADVVNDSPLKKPPTVPKKKLPTKEIPLVTKPDIQKLPGKEKDEEKEDTTDLRSFNWLLPQPPEKGNLNQNQNPAPNVSNPKDK